MNTNRIGLSWKWALLLCVGAGIALLMLFGTGRNLSETPMATTPQDGNGGSLRLQAPSFVNVASAEELDASGITSIVDEAGIAAYYQLSGGIEINQSLRDLYQVIEDETDSYIIGYFEGDIHVYMNNNGWIMAYHLTDSPTAIAFDHIVYQNTNQVTTNLYTVIENITVGIDGTFPTVTHYHFQYPNATNLTLVVDYEGPYNITIPDTFNMDEFSGKVFHDHPAGYVVFDVDGNTVIEGVYVAYGLISPSILSLGNEHTISFDGLDIGALALLYS